MNLKNLIKKFKNFEKAIYDLDLKEKIKSLPYPSAVATPIANIVVTYLGLKLPTKIIRIKEAYIPAQRFIDIYGLERGLLLTYIYNLPNLVFSTYCQFHLWLLKI
ncbi:MAG: hypothetical protein QXR09_00335 [Candidatus Aenigmatarchaeota archaeon]